MDRHLKGRVAIVSGAQGEIGQAIALSLSNQGATLILSSRNEESLLRLRATIEVRDGVAIAVPGDPAEVEFVESIAALAIRDFGRIDILINNEGILPFRASLEDYDYGSWWKVVDQCLTTHFISIQSVIPHMVERGYGKIVSLSSLGAIAGGPPLSVAYCAAKAGVVGLMKQVALEFGPRGIYANAVVIPDIDTDGESHLTEVDRQQLYDSDSRERYNIRPITHTIKPDEISNAVTFFASDDSSYITGETLNVVGGRYVAP